MSFVSRQSKQLKKEWCWESDEPRCETCKHFKAKFFVLVNSIPRENKARCKLGDFTTNPKAACDKWEGKK